MQFILDTQVLGMVLSKATGKSNSEYLQEKIWGPLGMTSNAYWLADKTNKESAYMGLHATVRDFAKLGLLYLNF